MCTFGIFECFYTKASGIVFSVIMSTMGDDSIADMDQVEKLKGGLVKDTVHLAVLDN